MTSVIAIKIVFKTPVNLFVRSSIPRQRTLYSKAYSDAGFLLRLTVIHTEHRIFSF